METRSPSVLLGLLGVSLPRVVSLASATLFTVYGISGGICWLLGTTE